MKKRYTAALAFIFAVIALSSVAEAKTSGVYDLNIQGVKVIVQPSNANEVIAVTVSIQGSFATGETNNPALPIATAAITAQSGTVKYPKSMYREQLASLVSSIGGSADAYHTVYTLNCVRPNFNESWKIFEDVLKEPLYDQTEFSNFRDQLQNEIAGRRSEPQSWNDFVLDSLWSAGHPAGRIIEPADVEALSIDAMKQFHQKTLDRSRMLIVVVGDVSIEDIQRKVSALLNMAPAIPAGTYVRQPYERIVGPGTTGVTYENRPLPTTYIRGHFNGPARNDPDYWPLRLACSILYDRLYEEVRTKRNLSYSPTAYFVGTEGLYRLAIGVSSTKPDSAMHVIFRELNKMRDEGVTDKELRDTKESFLTEVYMSQQTNMAAASRLMTTELETGDYHNALRLPDYIRNVTTDQIKQATHKYFHTILWTVVGDTSHLQKTDFLYP